MPLIPGLYHVSGSLPGTLVYTFFFTYTAANEKRRQILIFYSKTENSCSGPKLVFFCVTCIIARSRSFTHNLVISCSHKKRKKTFLRVCERWRILSKLIYLQGDACVILGSRVLYFLQTSNSNIVKKQSNKLCYS